MSFLKKLNRLDSALRKNSYLFGKKIMFIEQVNVGVSSITGPGTSWLTMASITISAAKINACSEVMVWADGSYMTTKNTYNFSVTRMVRTDPGSDVYYMENLYDGGTGSSASIPDEWYHNYNMNFRDASLSDADHTYKSQVLKSQSNGLTLIYYLNGGANIYAVGFGK